MTDQSSTTIPDGYMVNGQGHLVPKDRVKDIDMARNDLVLDIVASFKQQQQQLAALKANVLGEISAFIEMSAEQYGVKMGGKKGNISLLSFDGNYKLQLQISKYITFDERLQVAKTLIDECIHVWAKGARSEIMALVNDAFQVDREGKVSTSRILGLRRLDISDEKWMQAMAAIADSIQYTGSKVYIRAYQRVPDSDSWTSITLDFAALEVV